MMGEFVPNVEMFGLYAKIKQGASAEPHTYKIVGALESNSYVDIPIRCPETATIHEEVTPILRVIHCGICEEKVIRVAVKDVDSIYEYSGGLRAGAVQTWKDYQPTIPCKLGDVAWGIRNYRGHKQVKRGIISEMYFGRGGNGGMKLYIAIKGVCRGEWGKDIFKTREEADAAIKGDLH